ncbi:TVP38/TMEM64 family protein [Falsiroseomonas oryzae]|uniref:TVP38/TMEM64 family protein n=1 Tax=Falsiroseomonas oryzae TaxID=2766473 RepID=UPI0022EA9F94|nr:VTT domain-containing protein [Roseomonas sp. MO-31]
MTWLQDRRLWIALGVVALLAALRLTPAGELLSLETLSRHREALAGFVARNAVLAAAAYVATYVGVVAFSLPGATVMTLAGGFLFGAVLGTALTVVAATTGATLVFLFARRIFGTDALERLGPRAARIAAGIRREAVSYLLVLRLVPLFPFVLVNLVPAFCGVRLPVFVLTTLFGILPGSAVYTLAGAGLGEVLAAGGDFAIGRVLTPQILGALLGLAALSLAAIPLRRRFAQG